MDLEWMKSSEGLVSDIKEPSFGWGLSVCLYLEYFMRLCLLELYEFRKYPFVILFYSLKFLKAECLCLLAENVLASKSFWGFSI